MCAALDSKTNFPKMPIQYHSTFENDTTRMPKVNKKQASSKAKIMSSGETQQIAGFDKIIN